MKKGSSRQQDFVWRVLLNKYQADPEGFRSYLPEIAQELEKFSGRQKESHSTLTGWERENLCKSLLQLLKEKELSSQKAIQALEYCATLIQDASLPSNIERRTLVRLLRKVTGFPLGRIKRKTKIPMRDGEATKEIAILRGVHLHLTWDDRLVAISILPAGSKERSKALKFVGIAKDTASDVAQHHDAYLAEVKSDAIS